jgi:hypothetical protein
VLDSIRIWCLDTKFLIDFCDFRLSTSSHRYFKVFCCFPGFGGSYFCSFSFSFKLLVLCL